MHRRLVLLLPVTMLFSACSNLGLAYGQLARLAGWWADGYLDLDRAQQRQLNAALAALHAWHRREELPHWQALLEQASQALGGDLNADALRPLEAGVDASLRRTFEHAAPLARPLLARLRPEQWQHLRTRLHEKLGKSRKDAERQDADDRAKAFVKSLERWLGELPPAVARQAREQALAWPAPEAASWQERADRQALAYKGLRAWADGDANAGVERLLAATGRDPAHRGPATQAQHHRVQTALLHVLSSAPAQPIRQHWARWQADLSTLSRKL